MKVKLTLIALLFTGIGLCQNTYGQTDNREIGLRLSSSRGSDFVFKKEKRTNRYKRLRIGLPALGYSGSNDGFNFGLTFGIGIEKRKSIREDLFFIHGWEPRLSISSLNSSSDLRLGLGYVLGFQYDISDALSANIETIPSVTGSIDGGDSDSVFIDAGINSTAAISLVYKFQKKRK